MGDFGVGLIKRDSSSLLLDTCGIPNAHLLRSIEVSLAL